MSLSSGEEDNIDPANPANPAFQTYKKRRVQNLRACDRCRQKKIRCDGNQKPGSKCSHCVASESACMFTETTKKRGPPKRYVDSLESRLEKMEGLLSRLYPDGDFSQEIDLEGWSRGFKPLEDGETAKTGHPSPEVSSDDSTNPFMPSMHPGKTPFNNDEPGDDFLGPGNDESDDEYDLSQAALVRHLKQICINPNARRFYGKSSGIRLLREALDLKSEVSGTEPLTMKDVLSRGERRPDFWLMHPWERDRFASPTVQYDFPEPDLMASLVQLYFKFVAPMMPLLHRPTFMRDLQEGWHLVDDGFGGVVALVCAAASRYSHDPRVLLDDAHGHFHSAGWKWFNQVPLVRTSVLSAPGLYDLQVTALAVLFLHGSSPPQACWSLCGVGIRMAQDVGAHRRRAYNLKPTIENELWKRAFWVLHMLDIWMSSYLGRPCAISEENYDVDLPTECDDEYWENDDPALAFKQPPGKPSAMSYFIQLCKVNLIHSYALRTIYSINKSKVAKGLGDDWEQRIVSDLDSALNKWFDSIPDHLRWDPTRESTTHFLQSAALHSVYYYVQITIHRPFIPSFRKPSSLSFPSLAICANAARACSHVVDAQRRRFMGTSSPVVQLPAFVAGVILLLSLWGAKRSGMTLDATREMQDVRKCMMLLESGESRWPVAGRLRDLLCDLSNIGELPISQLSPLAASLKRERGGADHRGPPRSVSADSVQPIQVPTPPSDASTSAPPVAMRSIAGSRRVTGDLKTCSSSMSTFGPPLSQPQPTEAHHLPNSYSSTSYHSLSPPGDSSGLAPAPLSAPPMLTEEPKSFQPMDTTPSGSNGLSLLRDPPPRFPSSTPSTSQLMGAGLMPRGGGHCALNMAMTYAPPSTYFSSQMPEEPAQVPSLASGQSFGVPGTYDGEDLAYLGLGADQSELISTLAPMVPQDGQVGVDSDTMMMWSTMPSSFESEDWDTYLSNMVDLVNPQHTDEFQTV